MIVDSYRRQFKPSEFLAKRLAASGNLAKLKTALGRREGVPPVEDALVYPYSVEESADVRQFSRYYGNSVIIILMGTRNRSNKASKPLAKFIK